MKKIYVIFLCLFLLGCETPLSDDRLIIDGDLHIIRNKHSVSVGFLPVFAVCHDGIGDLMAEIEGEEICLRMNDYASVPFRPRWPNRDLENPVFSHLWNMCHQKFGYSKVDFFACD